MTSLHLHPDQIDLLVDGDAGYGMAPLRAHLAQCDECRAKYDELRLVAEAVDGLPHFTPHLRFSEDVLARVQMIEPWPVALAGSIKRIAPSSMPMRVLAGAGASAAALLVSGIAVWLAVRPDLSSWVASVFVDRTRRTVVVGAGEVAANALGADATSVLASGGPALLAITAGVLALATLGALLGFRRLAATSRAQRS